MLTRIRAWVKLLAAPGISKQKAIKIVKNLGEPETYIETNSTPLSEISFVSEQALKFLQSRNEPDGWENAAALIEKHQISFCTILDESYPFLLKNIPDPPLFLFYRGSLDNNDYARSIGVVGTRKPSIYGKTQCSKICSDLARDNAVIISGLAYGIDAIAHNAALQNATRTIAILGTGVDQIYPSSHRHLADQIIAKGALISEYLPGSKISMWNFPNRNRIISGISQGVWVVEGGQKSGALITAKYAREQSKPVFTLPADINRESAKGSNQLLQQNAVPVLSSVDILNNLGISVGKGNRTQKIKEELNELEQRIYQILLGEPQETPFDKLLIMSRLSVGELSTILLSLELKGYATKSSGNRIYPIK